MKLLRHPDGTLYLHTQSVDLARVLVKSNDGGRSWQAVPVRPQADVARDQHATAFTITSDGRLWLVHQAPTGKWRDWGMSVSEDGGQSWVTRTVHNWANFAPTTPGDPYERAMIAGTHPCLLVRPDDTLMLVLGLGHDDSKDYVLYEKTRSHNVMVPSRDGGRTWGEPSIVHQHGAEGDYALDPTDPDHILGVFRKQQPLLVGEDRETVEKEVGLWGNPLLRNALSLEGKHPPGIDGRGTKLPGGSGELSGLLFAPGFDPLDPEKCGHLDPPDGLLPRPHPPPTGNGRQDQPGRRQDMGGWYRLGHPLHESVHNIQGNYRASDG